MSTRYRMLEVQMAIDRGLRRTRDRARRVLKRIGPDDGVTWEQIVMLAVAVVLISVLYVIFKDRIAVIVKKIDDILNGR